MKNKTLIYSDLSKKQLQHLKEFYIQTKVNSMSNEELKEFVLEIISHQINDTIGKEEEIEAWREMSDFFGEKFEIIILEMQTKYKDDGSLQDIEVDPQKLRQDLLQKNSIEKEKNSIEKEKVDMWDD